MFYRLTSIICIICLLLFSACSSSKKGNKNQDSSDTQNNTHFLNTYIENFQYQKAIALVYAGQYSQDDLPAVIDLYYSMMTLAYSCFEASLILNQISLENYLSTEEANSQLINVNQYFLGYTYFLKGEREQARVYFEDLVLSYPKNHPLYPRIQILNAALNGIPLAAEITDKSPYFAKNLGFNNVNLLRIDFNEPTRAGSMELLDQAIWALNQQHYTIVDELFHSSLAPTFYYREKIYDTFTIDLYNPESLLLAARYYQYKAEEIINQLVVPDQDGLKNYYLGWIALYQRNFNKTIEKFNEVIKQEMLDNEDQNAIIAIKRALLTSNKYDDYYSYNLDTIEPQLIPAVKYWYYKGMVENTAQEKVHTFFNAVNSHLTPLLSKPDVTVPVNYTDCDFKELLYMLGRYFLLNQDFKTAERYFYHIFHFTESFYPKNNYGCGITFEYQPTNFLAFASVAMKDHPRLKRVVLQVIKSESVRYNIYHIPSEILSDIYISQVGKGAEPQI